MVFCNTNEYVSPKEVLRRINRILKIIRPAMPNNSVDKIDQAITGFDSIIGDSQVNDTWDPKVEKSEAEYKKLVKQYQADEPPPPAPRDPNMEQLMQQNPNPKKSNWKWGNR
ncbi:MAG: hypothetical protein OHK0047_22220 [Leptolyngbyaceae cyanobacterium]